MLDRDELLEHVEWLLNEGEAERAWALCKRGLRRYPRDAELWVYMGDSLVDSDRLKDADRAFRRAADLKSDWAIPVAKRAEVQLITGHLRRASNLADRSHELDRDLPHASYVKAICAELMDEHDVAHFWYRRAQRLNQDRYFAPPRVSHEQFIKEFHAALEHLRDGGLFAQMIATTRWEVLPKVETSRTELAEVSPMAECHFVLAEGDSVGEEASELQPGDEAQPLVTVGYVFAGNIVRNCRNEEDIYTQIYVCLLEELEALTDPDGDLDV